MTITAVIGLGILLSWMITPPHKQLDTFKDVLDWQKLCINHKSAIMFLVTATMYILAL